MTNLLDIKKRTQQFRKKINVVAVDINYRKIDDLIEKMGSIDFSLKLNYGKIDSYFLLIIFSVVNYRFVNISTGVRPEFSQGGRSYKGSVAFFENLKGALSQYTHSRDELIEFTNNFEGSIFSSSVANGIDDLDVRISKIRYMCSHIARNWDEFNGCYRDADINNLLSLLMSSNLYEDGFNKRLQHLVANIITNVENFHDQYHELINITALCDYRLPEYFLSEGIFNWSRENFYDSYVHEECIAELRALTLDAIDYMAKTLNKYPVEIDNYIWKLSRSKEKTISLIVDTEEF